MNEMIVLIDRKDKSGLTKGVIADMGSDLMFICDQIRLLEQMYVNQGEEFLGAFILGIEKEKPSKVYIPDNAFKMNYADDHSIQHPKLGKAWTTLVARIEPGQFGEEE